MTASSKKRKRSSRNRRDNASFVVYSALLLTAVLLIIVMASLMKHNVPDLERTLRAALADVGLEPEEIKGREGTRFWKVYVDGGSEASEKIVEKIKFRLKEKAKIVRNPLVTEEGGYGLLSLEISSFNRKVILYFLSSRAEPEPELPERPPPFPDARPMGAVIIDDVGYNRGVLRFFRKVSIPLTAAVLPHLPNSTYLAKEIRALGHEILCHMPMQPGNYPDQDPGRGAILLSMTPEMIRETMLSDFHSVPYAVGFNNHMGSAATANEKTMREVFTVAKAHGWVFVDSRTTAETVAEIIAREKGVPVVARDVFLDDLSEEEYIRGQLRVFEDRMKTRGYAVAIGHATRVTLTVLESEMQRFAESYRMITVTDLIQSQ